MRQEAVIRLIALLLVGIMVVFAFRMFGFQFIAYYFLFYIFSYYYNKYRNLLTQNRIIIVFLLLCWFAMASFWNMHNLPFFLKEVSLVTSSILQYAYRFTTAFVAIYLIFSSAPLLLGTSTKYNRKIAKIGQLSLGIYVVHLTLIIPMSAWLVRKMPMVSSLIMILISFVLVSIISILIVELLNKNKYTSRNLLGRI